MVEIITSTPLRLDRVPDVEGSNDFMIAGLTARGRFQTSVRIWMPFQQDRRDNTGNVIERGSPFQTIARVSLGNIPVDALQPDGSLYFEIERQHLRDLASIIVKDTVLEVDRAFNLKWKW